MSNVGQGTVLDPLNRADFKNPIFRRGKHCKCQRCAVIQPCSTNTDFFVRSCDITEQDSFGPLYCMNCVKALYVIMAQEAKNTKAQ